MDSQTQIGMQSQTYRDIDHNTLRHWLTSIRQLNNPTMAPLKTPPRQIRHSLPAFGERPESQIWKPSHAYVPPIWPTSSTADEEFQSSAQKMSATCRFIDNRGRHARRDTDVELNWGLSYQKRGPGSQRIVSRTPC